MRTKRVQVVDAVVVVMYLVLQSDLLITWFEVT